MKNCFIDGSWAIFQIITVNGYAIYTEKWEYWWWMVMLEWYIIWEAISLKQSSNSTKGDTIFFIYISNLFFSGMNNIGSGEQDEGDKKLIWVSVLLLFVLS